jgi:AcrR family transcriptional regulator
VNARDDSTEAPTSRAAGGKHRDNIFMALHDCIIDRGYARTTLADVARAARMSPSHLLYYFPGKDAILAQYFEHVAGRIITRLESFRGEDPERQIELLATLFFAGRGISKSEVGFMLECFGVAVHDRDLQQQKTELDRYCKSYLREVFERSPCGPAKAADFAEIAYAILVGLRTAAYFDDQLRPQQALEMFRDEMLGLASTTGPKRHRKARASTARARRPMSARPSSARD